MYFKANIPVEATQVGWNKQFRSKQLNFNFETFESYLKASFKDYCFTKSVVNFVGQL